MAEQMTPEEIQRVFDAFNEEFARTGTVSKEMQIAFKDASKGIKDYSAILKDNLKNLGTSVFNMAKEVRAGAQGASVYNDTIESGTKALAGFLETIPVFGKYLAAAATAAGDYAQAANKLSDKLFENYQQLSRFGAANAQGFDDIAESVKSFNYNIESESEKFINLIGKNSESLALLGGTVNQGVKAFSSVADKINKSGLETEFRLLGMTTEDINQGMAGYLRIQTLSGTAQRKTTAELAQGSADYLRQLDLVTKLTGKNAEAQQAETEARMANERYIGVRIALERKEEEARARGDKGAEERAKNQMAANELILKSVPEGAKKGFQDLMSGFANTKDAQQAMRLYGPEMTNMLMRQNFSVQEGMQTLSTAGRRAGKVLKQFEGNLRSESFGNTFGNAAAAVQLSSKNFVEALESGNEQQIQQILNGDKNIKSQVAMRQDQLSAAHAMQDFIRLGITPATTAMQKLAGVTESAATAVLPGSGSGTTGTGRGGEISPLFGGGKAGPAAGKTANAQKAMAYFISQGYTPEQAAGLVGNLQAESGANLNINAVGDSGKAKGIAQFHPDRQANFARFAGKSIDKSTLEEQLAFIAHELKTTESAAGGKLKSAGSARDAAAIVDKFYERSSGTARAQRQVNAEALLGSQAATQTASARPSGGGSANDVAAFYGIGGSGGGLNLLSGPNDKYKPAISSSGPDAAKTNAPAGSQTSEVNPRDFMGAYMTGQAEMIALLKTNNAQNQKILQAARN